MIVIIGGGISGLSVAWQLKKNGTPYIVLEASPQVGGVIQTVKKDNFLLELGPNSLLCDEETLDFLKEVGLENEILPAAEVNKNRFVFKEGKYRKLPSSPPSLLFNSFFNWKTKFRIFQERNVTSVSPENETVEDFFIRRFGKEVTDWALNPFISGIYAGDPKKLLIKHTFPLLVELEREYGSVIRGMIKRKGSTARKATYSLKDGLAALPQTMTGKLNVKLNSPVKHIRKEDGKWKVVLESEIIEAEKVVLSLPAAQTEKILAPYFPDAARAIGKINYPPMVAVHTAFREEDVRQSLDGFGGLNPKVAQRFAAGSIWSSSIFEGRTQTGKVLITTFVGGSQYESHTQLSDEQLKARVVVELKEAYRIAGDPTFVHLHRWEKAIPQYDMQFERALSSIDKLKEEGLLISANWLGGVSVIDCIKKGKELVESIYPG